jgi:tetratricopeptide (TPR) repeat protein
VEEIQGQAERLEKEYEWLKAAESYEKALKLLPEDDFTRKGETYERLGYALYRAAFQAESIEEFRQRLRRAIADYEKAKEHYQELSDTTKKGITLRCDAMNAYMGYWLASEASEKKRLLGECWRSTQEALKASKESGNAEEYGATFNQLSASALFRYCYELDYDVRKKIIKEITSLGEEAVKLLSTIDAPVELARVLARTAFALSLFAYYFLDLNEKGSCVRKAQGYWSKAKEASEDAAMLEMLFPIACAHDLLWGFGTQEIITSLKKALEHARSTRDKLIIGSASDWLAYHTGWSLHLIDDYDRRAERAKTVFQYAEDAKRQYSVISFISPRADAFWIEAIHSQLIPGLDEETEVGRKRDMIKRAIAAGRDALKPAKASEYPYAIENAHHLLGAWLADLAWYESRTEEKKSLFEEALQHANESAKLGEQLGPLSYWDLGMFRGRIAVINFELANLESDSESKKSMLQAATLEFENAVQLIIRDLSFQPDKKTANFNILGFSQYWAGMCWSRLYRLTCEKDNLRKAIEAFNAAIESYKKVNLTSRTAECQWKIAQAYDELDEHLTAARNFSLASDTFKGAAETISTLKSFYENHALYMQAWSEIEKARYHHEKQEYDIARNHFEKAASIHKSLKQWSYLAPNYAAWAQLEQAEELSRKEQTEEAAKAFEHATDLFTQTKRSIQAQLDNIEDPEEKQFAHDMVKATDARHEYCVGRMAVEEGKIFDKQGDHYRSSEKYDSAAEIFEKTRQNSESEQERKEFRVIIALSKAWQKMTLAEAEASPELYVEASRLFEEAKESSPNEKTRMLLLGHSRFCKALEAGTRFADSRNMDLYVDSVKYIESAANYYVKAGFPKAAEYSEATKLLLDAYMQIDSAAREIDPEKKVKLYKMAEKVLETSAGSFVGADHPEKREQVLGLIGKVKKEQELAASLTEMLHAPAIVSSTTSFSTPAPTREQAIGSERFEHADVQANLIIKQKELKIGENLGIELELVNAGKGPAVLIKVTEMIPKGFEVTEKPENCRVEDSYINLKGKRLDPLKTEEVKLVLKPTLQGTFSLKPTVLYLDENGKYKSHEPEPVTITVRELGIKGWLKGER